MHKFKPNIYQKDIHSINYDMLKEKGIKCLIFDLDNTLALISEKTPPKKTIALLKKLKKDFLVLIITNNTRKRIIPYQEKLDLDCICWAMKPTTKGLREIKRKYKLKKSEMIMIGDQIVTDVLSGSRFNIKTALVDPLGTKDLKITSLNRLIENKIVNRYAKKKLFERGKYYE